MEAVFLCLYFSKFTAIITVKNSGAKIDNNNLGVTTRGRFSVVAFLCCISATTKKSFNKTSISNAKAK